MGVGLGRRGWLLGTGLAACLAGLGLALLNWPGSGGDDSLETLRRRGEIRVGLAVEPPYALVRADGSMGGESPEVAKALAERLGLKVGWVVTDFDRLIPELEEGRFDVIAAGLFVRPDRARRVRFTRPTLRVRAGWLLPAGSGRQMPAYESAQPSPQQRIAVLAGSVEQAQFARPNAAAGTVVVVPDAMSGQVALLSGAADALALSWPTVQWMAAASQGRLQAQAAPSAGPVDQVALAVRRDAAALQAALDGALAGYIGSAEHLAMLRSLGFDAGDLP